MKKFGLTILLALLFSCGDEFPEFNPAIEHIYKSEFKVWKKKDLIVNNSTGEITTVETRELNLQYIFFRDKILISTDRGNTYDTLTDIHISIDSIAYTYPNNGMHESFFVRDLFRMRDGSLIDDDQNNPRNEAFPELDGFFLFIELEDKEKRSGENSVITETYLMYSEGFATAD